MFTNYDFLHGKGIASKELRRSLWLSGSGMYIMHFYSASTMIIVRNPVHEVAT